MPRSIAQRSRRDLSSRASVTPRGRSCRHPRRRMSTLPEGGCGARWPRILSSRWATPSRSPSLSPTTRPSSAPAFAPILELQPGITVCGEAGDGRDAIDIARKRHPTVVLMDIQMPDIDGLEATCRIVAEAGDRPIAVLMLTTFDLNEYVKRCVRGAGVGSCSRMSAGGPRCGCSGGSGRRWADRADDPRSA